MTVLTRHGRFNIARPRLRDYSGQEIGLPCLSGPRVSQPLRSSSLFWANRLSFGDVARLL